MGAIMFKSKSETAILTFADAVTVAKHSGPTDVQSRLDSDCFCETMLKNHAHPDGLPLEFLIGNMIHVHDIKSYDPLIPHFLPRAYLSWASNRR